MRSILFYLGSRPVYAYGFAVTVAFLVGSFVAARRAPSRGLSARNVYVTAVLSFVAAMVGSRIVYLLVEEPERLSQPAAWFQVWEGGLVFYGGFFAAVLSSVLYARAAGISFWKLADTIAPSIALGHAIVRIGCFLNGCCYGKPASWGVVFPSLHDGVPRQPAQLYEAGVGVLLFAILLFWERAAPLRDGDLLLLYISLYGGARFVIEIVRDDGRGMQPLGWTVSQVVGMAALLGGGFLLITRTARLSRDRAAPPGTPDHSSRLVPRSRRSPPSA